MEKVDLTKWAEHRHKMLFVLDGLDECTQVLNQFLSLL